MKATLRRPARNGSNVRVALPAHLAARQTRLRELLEKRGVDALLVTSPLDVRYLTGFCGEAAWMLVTSRDLVVISDRRFEEELRDSFGYVKTIIRKKSHAEELGKLVRAKHIATLAVQAEHFTLDQRKTVSKHSAGIKLRPVSGWLLELRSIKDAVEVDELAKAVAIQEQALEQTIGQLRAGMTEREITGILESHMWRLGADGPGFPTIVAAGEHSSLPHHGPGDRRLAEHEPLLVDYGALVGGYHSDMTRVVFLGQPSAQFRKIYEIVRAAHAAAVAAVAPGRPLAEVDAAARRVIVKAGYGKQFSHGIGHGIGLQIHEEPFMRAKALGELRPGQVVTIEPGIYLPGVGGVRLEDDVLVTDSGQRRLCALPTDLKWAVV
jgi:Xaa-Pro aminopeptidase